MRSSSLRRFVIFLYVPTGLFHLRQISKEKQYDMIGKKYVRGRWLFTRKNLQSFQNVDKIFSGAKNCTKRDADDDERASMTMNEGETSSYAHLYGISLGFSETWAVRAETYVGYVQSTCRVQARYAQNENEDIGPVNLDGGYYRRRLKMFLVYHWKLF